VCPNPNLPSREFASGDLLGGDFERFVERYVERFPDRWNLGRFG
jgi:hypothetical protein